MKLYAYILNGKPLTDYVSWSYGDVYGPAFLIGNTSPSGYSDVSSIINWSNYGGKLKDYNYLRDRIKELTDSIGFNNLTTEEKIISANYFVVGKTERDTVLTEEEQYDAWSYLIAQSQDSRFNRWEQAKKYISYKLTPINSSDLAKSTSDLCNDYINYNIITKTKDGISGLFDYLRGEGDYVSNGYPSKSYWTQGDEDSLMDILLNGNY